jgi:TP901 family phage tail tape measure protein
MTQLGTASLAFGALAAAGVVVAINKFAEFDAAMSGVQAATHESEENMKLLRDAAIEAGASTVFSATEAANAVEELSKAGVSASSILGGALKGSLDLASAGSLGVAEAAEIAATAMTQFKLEGEDVPHIADLLAAGAGKAQGSVQDLAGALDQAGLVAGQTGLSLEETTGGLAAFAAAGLTGSDAGTSFKAMLQRLTPQSAEAAALMDKLGISAYDAQGDFIGLEGFAGNLQDSLKNMTVEQRNSTMATLFGSDAVRAAAVLYDQGAEGISNWIDMVDDSGYAAETARIKLDNLNGYVEALGGAFDTLLIKSGSAADGLLRGLVQAITGVVDAFNDAPIFVQQTALALAAVTAAIALAGGAFLVGVPQVAAFNAALVTLSTSSMPGVAAGAGLMMGATSKAATVLAATAKFLTGPWGVALAAAGVGVVLLTKYLDGLQASSGEITNSLTTASSAADIFALALKGKDAKFLQDVKGDLADLPSVLQAAADQSANVFARFDQTNFPAFDALREIGVQLGELAGSDLPAAQSAFRTLAAETDGSEQSLWRLISTMPGYKDALTDQANALGINVTTGTEAENKTALLGIAFGVAGEQAVSAAEDYAQNADEAAALKDQLNQLLDTFNEMNGVGQDAISTNASYQESLFQVSEYIRQAQEGVEGFTVGLDAATVAGSSNLEMLAGLAADSQSAAAAQFALDGNTQAYMGTLEAGRQNIINSAMALGATQAEAVALADAISKIPSEKEIDTLANTQEAINSVDSLIDVVNGREATITVNATSKYIGSARGDGRANGGTIGMAGGGTAYGLGTSKSDSIPVMLSRGEEVIQEPFASRNRQLLKALNRGEDMRNLVASSTRGGMSAGGGSSGMGGNVSVELSSRGGVDLLKYVDVRVNGALVNQERSTQLDQLAGRAVR